MRIEKAAPAVSIIVPVYNAERTLMRCADSILSQRFSDFELLLVDDGSTDSSGALCDHIAAGDGRVSVFHKKNGGVSEARNLAIGLARGKYLQFADSDDWIAPDATLRFVETAEKNGCDLVVSDFYRVVSGRASRKGNIPERGVFSLSDYAAYMMKSPADFYYGALWNKLYRRDIVTENGIKMDPAISWCEDFMFNLEYLRRAKVFCAVQSPLYYYVLRKGSLASSGANIAKAAKIKRVVFECYNDFYKSVLPEEEYERMRFRVYRFLVDSADDGSVPLRPTASEKNRLYISPDANDGEDALSALYRREKLIDLALEPVASRYELSLRDARLLLRLGSSSDPRDRRDLADRLHTTPQGVSRALQRLSSRGFVAVKDLPSERRADSSGKPEKHISVALLPPSEEVLFDLRAAVDECERLLTASLSGEETALCRELSEKTDRAARAALESYRKQSAKLRR